MTVAGSQQLAGRTRATFSVWGMTAVLQLTDAGALPRAHALLRAELAAMDAAANRFLPDSELSRVNAGAGGPPTPVSPLFVQALKEALRAAALTGGAVDPTVGGALIELGYDRDIGQLRAGNAEHPGNEGGRRAHLTAVAGGPGCVRLDPGRPALGQPGSVALPAGVALDLGATAKALAADRAAYAIAADGCGVLVGIGGDVAVAGPPPPGGWAIRVTDDHDEPAAGPGQTVAITAGGLATSSITTRTWRQRGRSLHHILDPATGLPAVGRWRTISVTAGSCVDANAASTAAIVLGAAAAGWLSRQQLPARLVDRGGRAVAVGGWPTEGGPDDCEFSDDSAAPESARW